MSTTPVNIIYIAGYGRSGSTLLQRMLGAVEGCMPVGEVAFLWETGLRDNHLCGCDLPLRDCPFWGAVVERAFGGPAQIDVAAMSAFTRALTYPRTLLPLSLSRLRSPRFTANLSRYRDTLGRLYRSIQQSSGCRYIVDSSKSALYALALGSCPELRLHVVHLIRDSRATAFSWQRKKRRTEIHWEERYMDRYSPLRAAIEWNLYNELAGLLRFSQMRYLTLHYEDLAAQPRAALLRLGQFLGAHWQRPSDIDGQLAYLGVDHSISGNPSRFERGAITIRPDSEWQEKMSRGQRALVTGLTFPLLLRHGYPLRSLPPAAPHADR